MDRELQDRLAELVTAAVARREANAAVRQQLAERRQAGKTMRHRDREKIMAERITRCRYMRLSGEMCTGEALDPNGDVLICAKHAARIMALVQAGLARR